MAGWRVTEQAVAAMNNMSAQLQEIAIKIHQESEKMKSVYEDSLDGLGAHSGDISELIHSVELAEQDGNRLLTKLQLKLTQAARIRQNHIDKNKYGSGGRKMTSASETAAIMGRMYDGLYRSRRIPHETSFDGEQVGSWKGNTFVPLNSAMPTRFNPNKQTYGEIRAELEKKYGLQFEGVPYVNGYADFSSIAVARINFAEVVERRVKKDQQKNSNAHKNGIDFEPIFINREKNFEFADEIAAEQQIEIPRLELGYTKNELSQWRKDNYFSWDESFDNGYILVPRLVHENIPHTGLVGVTTHGSEIESNGAKKLRPHSDGADGYVSEEDAIISISELNINN